MCLPSRFRMLALTALLAAPAFGASTQAVGDAPVPANVCPQGQVFATPGFCGHDERIRKGSGLRVAVLLFEGAQLIDYAAPMEILGQAGATLFTVAPTKAPRTTAFGLKVTPDHSFDDAPPADLLLVPGGEVSEIVLNPAHKAWLVKRVQESKMVLAVCTGAFVLGYAGLLDGLPATTYAGQIQNLKREFPNIGEVVRDRRFVDTGKIITTAGLSAGIDGALHVVERWYGRFDANDLARGIEYDWVPDRQGSFAELAAHRMPHWPAVVPAGTAWQRTAENGGKDHWVTVAQVGFDTTPEDYLDQMGRAVSKGEWRLTEQGRQFRTFSALEGARAWTLRLSLAPAKAAGQYELTAEVGSSSR